MRDGFVAVEDQNGWAFVQLARVVAVSGAFSIKGGPMSRRLILENSPVMLYCLNSAENATALGFDPAEWESDEPKPIPKPRLTKGRAWAKKGKPATVAPGWNPSYGIGTTTPKD